MQPSAIRNGANADPGAGGGVEVVGLRATKDHDLAIDRGQSAHVGPGLRHRARRIPAAGSTVVDLSRGQGGVGAGIGADLPGTTDDEKLIVTEGDYGGATAPVGHPGRGRPEPSAWIPNLTGVRRIGIGRGRVTARNNYYPAGQGEGHGLVAGDRHRTGSRESTRSP